MEVVTRTGFEPVLPPLKGATQASNGEKRQ